MHLKVTQNGHNSKQGVEGEDLIVVKWLKSNFEAPAWLPCTLPRQGSSGSLPQVRPLLPPPVWSLMGISGTPTADRQGPQGVQQESAGSLAARLSSPAVAHAPHAVAAAQVPRGLNPGSGTSNRKPASGTGSLSLSNRPTPRSPSVAHLVSPSHQANCRLVYLPLVQWPSPTRCTPIPAAIDCGPAFFTANRSACVRSVAPLCHMSKAWRTCLSLRACSLG